MSKSMTPVLKVAVGTALAVGVAAANAAIDTTAALANITDANTATLAIGAAVFAVGVSVKLYKWLRSAL